MATTRALRLAALLAGLAGCATWRLVTAPDGLEAMEVRCQHDQWRCAEKAERICNHRYAVLDDGVREHTVVRPNGIPATHQMVFQGFIVIRCK